MNPFACPYPETLWVIADDFGLHPSIDEGILYCLGRGWVNGVSCFHPNERNQSTKTSSQQENHSFKTLLELAAIQSNTHIGAHLSLYDIPLLIPGMQNFESIKSPISLLHALLRKKVTLRQIKKEWEAQIECLKQFTPLHHINSHQHLHMLPMLWPIVANLAERFNIPHIRVPWEGSFASWAKQIPAGFCLQTLSRIHKSPKHRFIGFSQSMRFTGNSQILNPRWFKKHPIDFVEVMVHPGFRSDDLLSKFGHWKANWDEEIESLKTLHQKFKGVSEIKENSV